MQDEGWSCGHSLQVEVGQPFLSMPLSGVVVFSVYGPGQSINLCQHLE